MNSSCNARAKPGSDIRRKLTHIALLVLTQAALCCIGTRIARADESAELSIQGKWSEKFHDVLRYRRVSATQYPDGRRTAREYLATINVSVHSHRDELTTLSWKYTNLSLDGKALADLALEVSVTPDGDVELVNVDDLQRKVLQEASTMGKADHPLELGGDELVKMAASKEALANFYLRDAVIFFYPQGTTVRRDRPVELDGEIAGIAGDTLKVVDHWTVLPARDLPAGTVAVEWVQDFDRHDVERYFSTLGKVMGVKLDANKGMLTKKALFALDRTTFWPHLVIASTKTSVQSSYEQFDSIELRSSLLDPNWKH